MKNSHHNKTCVVMMVTANYQKYIPIFLYYCLNSYPEYSVRIFLSGGMGSQLKKTMKVFGSTFDVEIIENSLDGIYGNKGHHEFKSLRWLFYHGEYEKFDNLYFGDIDIAIVREDVTLDCQHLNHCNEAGLPYSNCVRPNSQRLSGLHFVKREEYYDKMMPTIDKYMHMLKNGKLANAKNEEVLYKIVKEAGVGFHDGWLRPHHGIHLGLWRKDRTLNFSEDSDPGKEYRKLVGKYFALQSGNMFDDVVSIGSTEEFLRANRNLKIVHI